ncbi:hypothetical protein GO013_04805 [Pseudodesulfovibrio sp. JC047]|uniref:HNH endonuclease n=1 Tax=Pseudodesulfovibrio sp. JC047 TaxID=2683199 RepID=UPI0013CF95CC|nr:HNH endonuclease signature motif containing protein [Pseudodesulfovibrio sp. JC047]NDV18738.1 hypothetical protein [Pseudodesulfovibrio sp. JC047]
MSMLEKYVDALNAEFENFTDLQKQILKTHYEVFAQKATAPQLAAHLGIDYRTINRSYGTFAKRINSRVKPDSDKCEWHLDGIVTAKKNEDKHWVLSLRPLFAEALELVGLVEVDKTVEIVAEIKSDLVNKTTVEAIVNARIGQGRFRHALIEFWRGCCAVTGVEDARLLRASHIKPWAVSSNTERLDPANGLLLSPSLDAAFDAGLISFSDSGKILISDAAEDLHKLGISSQMKINGLTKAHKNYLQYHQKKVFKG